MSRRKSDAVIRYKPVQDCKGSAPPEWTDMLRGCMIAIIEQTRVLWDVHFRSAKERILDHLCSVAEVLRNQDNRMNEWAVLEKWCWMMEMYARSVEFQIPWRYANSMNFLSSTPSNGNAGCGNVYLGCLSKERFIQLTLLYGTADEQVATTLVLTKKFKRFATGTGLFTNEMEQYGKLIANQNGTAATVTVPVLASAAPLQIIAPVELLKDTQTAPRRKAKATRSNASATAVPTTTATTIAEALAAGQIVATSIASGAPIFKQEPLEFSSENSAFTLVKADGSEGSARNDTPPASWAKETTLALIDSIKIRPALWNLGNANYKLTAERKKQLGEVALLLAAACGTHHSEQELITKWAKLRETFSQHHKKVKAGTKNLPEWEFYARMLFLSQEDIAEPEPSTSSSATAVIVTSDDMPLQRLLNSMPVESPIGAKRPRLSSPGTLAKKNEITQISVSTWVPPKEDAIAAAFQAVGAPTPVTAATAVVTSGAPLPTFFMEPLNKELPPPRKTQVNGVGKRQHNNHESSSNRDDVRSDRWFHLGRLVEMTCRDLETKDEAVAVVLQKELGELLCKYQLKCIKK